MPATEPPDPGRKQVKCTLSSVTIRYLNELSKTGMHGSGIAGVMASLIEQGIREAFEKGYIKLLDATDDQTTPSSS